MKITINGNEYFKFETGINVHDLIQKLNLSDKQIIVELNQIALLQKDYKTSLLNDGDIIEIVQIAAGG
ncbi:MAG: sulfur carrier protein ThiS [Verrucomicrobiota bacterium]|nr:sulfur carrier protein ThiS [Verrucomicrobiota bacterium]